MIGTGIALLVAGVLLMAVIMVFAVKSMLRNGAAVAGAAFDLLGRQAGLPSPQVPKTAASGNPLKDFFLKHLAAGVLMALSGAMALVGFVMIVVGIVR